MQQINYFTTVTNVTHQTFEDNDITNIDDRDTSRQSVNQNITAFGDVNQDFDNDVVSGDGGPGAATTRRSTPATGPCRPATTSRTPTS